MNRAAAIFMVLLLSLGIARGESVPDILLEDLLSADVVAIGRFSDENGKLEFIRERSLRDDAAAFDDKMQAFLKDRPRAIIRDSQGLRLRSGGIFEAPGDAERPGIWFLLTQHDTFRVSRQPIELEHGFLSLFAKKEPDAFFQLTQRVDFDMYRRALERLFETSDAALVERLHEVALQSGSDLSDEAYAVLLSSKQIKPDRFWGAWSSHSCCQRLFGMLSNRDPVRAMRELTEAIAKEKDSVRLDTLLYLIPNDSPQQLEIALPYLTHSSELVRQRVLNLIWDHLWRLHKDALTSPEAKKEIEIVGKRVVPLLEQRMEVETDPGCKQSLTRMLTRTNTGPWILSIPNEHIKEPIPPYSEEAELAILINQLSSGNNVFVTESAGKELREYFPEEGFKRLREATVHHQDSDVVRYFHAMGYLRDRRILDYLVQHTHKVGIGESSFSATLSAIGCQNDKSSFYTLKEIVKRVSANQGGQDWFGNFSRGLAEGLSFVTDEAALDYLEELEPEYAKADRVPYLRARAIHGDRGAVAELLERVEKEPSVRFRSRWRGDSDELNALISVDTPEATEAMKRYVRDSWPSRSDVLDDFYIISSSSAVRLENEAGNFRRDSVLAEVARRDPHWLAETALQKMGSDSQEARIYAADIFEQLTGQNGGYNPKAFARERAEPLKGLAAWWQAHKGENREQWLIAYFNEKGFPLTNFDQKNLSILVEALSGDYRLHYFAVEQISVICGKYFTSFRRLESQKNLEAMKARIVGWLKARGYL